MRSTGNRIGSHFHSVTRGWSFSGDVGRSSAVGHIKIVVAAAIGALLASSVSVFGGSYVISDLGDCSARERAIVEEYPHHGDRRIATYPWTFSCSVRYTTDAGRKEVLGYYNEVLRREGWEVVGFQTSSGRRYVSGKRLSRLWRLPESAGGVLVARRGGHSYWVSYDPPDKNVPDLPNDEALVVVLANDHPPPASRFQD